MCNLFKDFSWQFFRHLFQVWPLLLFLISDVVGRYIAMDWPIPNYVPWLILTLAVFISSFLTYNDLRTKSSTVITDLQSKVISHEWEYRRQKRIELLGDKYNTLPKLIMEISNELEFAIPRFVSSPENKLKLSDALKLIEKLDSEDIIDYSQAVTQTRRILDLNNIGFHRLVRDNRQIALKLADFLNIYKTCDDKNLVELLNDYEETLFEFVTLSIVKEHIDSSEKLISKRLKYINRIERVKYKLAQVQSRATKRINELRLGDEPT